MRAGTAQTATFLPPGSTPNNALQPNRLLSGVLTNLPTYGCGLEVLLVRSSSNGKSRTENSKGRRGPPVAPVPIPIDRERSHSVYRSCLSDFGCHGDAPGAAARPKARRRLLHADSAPALRHARRRSVRICSVTYLPSARRARHQSSPEPRRSSGPDRALQCFQRERARTWIAIRHHRHVLFQDRVRCRIV
jgi:hypothetical protein